MDEIDSAHIPAAHIPALIAWLADAVGESAVAKGLATDGEGLGFLLSGAALPDENGKRSLLRMAGTAEAAGLGTRPEMPCVPIPAAVDPVPEGGLARPSDLAGPAQARPPPVPRVRAEIEPRPPMQRPACAPISEETRSQCLDLYEWAVRLCVAIGCAPALYRLERAALRTELAMVTLTLVEDHDAALAELGLSWYGDELERERHRLRGRLRQARSEMPGFWKGIELWFKGQWPIDPEVVVARGERMIRFQESVTGQEILPRGYPDNPAARRAVRAQAK